MTFELNGSKPIYKQLIDEILAKIRSGELRPGEKLPTERSLAQQLYVSRGTIKKALTSMRKRSSMTAACESKQQI